VRRLIPLFLLVGCGPAVELPEPVAVDVASVDVFTGTDSLGFGVGSAFPGPTLPFGMARPGPDTQGESSTLWSLHCSGYRNSDPWIAGFSQMRLHGTGIPDYGFASLQPVVWDAPKRKQREYRRRKNAATEQAGPGWYSVEFDGGARAELTATARTALHRYTLDAAGPTGLVLDLSHVLPDNEFVDASLVEVDERTWEGHVSFRGSYSGRHGGETAYFVVSFDAAPTSVETWEPADADGAHGAFFALTGVVEVQVGLSFVDAAGARANLAAEASSFDGARAAAEAEWSSALSVFAAVGGDETAQANLAASAYHALLMPTLFTDVDGRYRGFDEAVHEAEGWTYYTDFSLWDTYRTQHPLFNLIAPERQGDFVRSLLAMGDQGGRIPRWPLGTGYTGGMVGDPGILTIADALTHGVAPELDRAAVLEQLLESAPQSRNWGEWEALGWLSTAEGGSVAKTLEFAWSDAAVADLAAEVGDAREGEIRARSQGWRDLFDVDAGFIRARNPDGSWLDGFEPLDNADPYVEGNAWHYSFMAPHDAEQLIALHGGPEAFVDKLSEFFREASYDPEFSWPSLYYWHGNEPSIHAAYLFALAGRPDLTRQWARWIEDERYFPGPEGLPGNDDAGTLAAWWLWSAAGLYPIAGSQDYVLGMPRFPAVRMRAGNGWLTTRWLGEDGDAVVRITVDGEEWSRPTIEWERIANGAEIVFE